MEVWDDLNVPRPVSHKTCIYHIESIVCCHAMIARVRVTAI